MFANCPAGQPVPCSVESAAFNLILAERTLSALAAALLQEALLQLLLSRGLEDDDDPEVWSLLLRRN